MPFAAEYKAFRRCFMWRRRESLCSEARNVVQSGKMDQMNLESNEGATGACAQ